MARLHLARGQHELAATLLRRHLGDGPLGILHAPALALLAEVHLALGRPDDAAAIARQLDAFADSAPLPYFRAVASYVRGLVDGGVAALEVALSSFAAAGMPYETARTRLALARALVTEQPAVAAAEAKAALDTFDRLGATPDADATAALLRSLGVQGRTGPRTVEVLSKREREVFELVAQGLSNPEIAARLYISRKTASHHVSNVLAKLGLRNRTEAAGLGSRRTTS